MLHSCILGVCLWNGSDETDAEDTAFGAAVTTDPHEDPELVSRGLFPRALRISCQVLPGQ